MEMTTEELPNGVTRALLRGRMDIEGAAAVDFKIGALTETKRALVIDLAGVSFIASMGLRTLMMCARSLAAKGGKLALANPQPNVLKVLQTSGIPEIIPVHSSWDEALAAIVG